MPEKIKTSADAVDRLCQIKFVGSVNFPAGHPAVFAPETAPIFTSARCASAVNMMAFLTSQNVPHEVVPARAEYERRFYKLRAALAAATTLYPARRA